MDTQSLAMWEFLIPRSWSRTALDIAGVGIIAASQCVGTAVQQRLGVPVPGSVVGMGLVLVLLWTGVVQEAWLTRVTSWLLLLLPALFVPLYVVPLADPKFWVKACATLLPAAIVGAAITLTVAGWFAARMVRS